MTDTMEHIKSRLKKLTKTEDGWSACCPAHPDSKPSLSLKQGRNGGIVLHCHAGCKPEKIVGELGLEMKDLMPPGEPVSRPNKDRKGYKPRVFKKAADAVRHLKLQHGEPTATYVYEKFLTGQPVGVVVRWQITATEKNFRPVSLYPEGWMLKGMPVPRPLYQINRCHEQSTVFVVEGEKCVDAAWNFLQLHAVTSPHGAESPATADWLPLAGKRVIILPDNDEPGDGYAKTAADILLRLTPAPTVKVVRLPNLPDGGDIVDWIAANTDGDGRFDPAGLRGEIEGLADKQQPLTLAGLENGKPKKGQVQSPTSRESSPALICLADVQPQKVRWLWPGRIPFGRLSLLAGPAGLGKSMLTIDMAARISRGMPWPDGTPCLKGSVLLITAEDDPADTIRPRLDAAGADVSRVHILTGIKTHNDKGEELELAWTLADCDILAAALAQIRDCVAVVIDPIGSFIGGRLDSSRDNEVRSILTPASKIAAKTDVAVIMAAHVRKAASTHADDMVLGSRAFTALSRSVLHLVEDEGDRERRLLLPGKCNLARQAPGLAFKIADGPVLAWEDGVIDQRADDHYSEACRSGPGADSSKEAEEFLKSALAGGPRLTKDIEEEAKEAHGISERTLNRARKKLGIDAFKRLKSWYLELPSRVPDADAANGHVELGTLGTLDETTEKQEVSEGSEVKGAKGAKGAKLPVSDDLADQESSEDVQNILRLFAQEEPREEGAP